MPDRPPFAPGASYDSSPRVEVASLAGLRRALEDPGYAAVCFVGPPGQSRADLLYSLAEALRPRCRLVYLRGTALPPGGFWMRVADALELASGYDARRRVLGLAGDLSRSGQALLLALDDAQALPADTLYALLATARSQPGLLLVLAHGAGLHLAGPLPEDVAVVLSGESSGPIPPPATGVEPVPPAVGPRASASDAALQRLVELPREARPIAGAAPLAGEAPPAATFDAATAAAGSAPALPPTPLEIATASSTDAGASAAPAPPWEASRARLGSRRRARERRRERRRRVAWGASGLALGLLIAAAIDFERWRPLAVELLGGIPDVAPQHPPPPGASPAAPFAPRPEAPPPAPVARNAPPDDAASAPTGDPALGAPAAPTPDVAAPPPSPERAAPVPDAAAPPPAPDAAPPASPGAAAPPSPPGVGPSAGTPAAPGIAPEPAAAPAPAAEAPASAPPRVQTSPAAPAPAPEPSPAAPAPGGPQAALGSEAPPAPAPAAAPTSAPPPRLRRRGPLALGALAVAADEPVVIEIDGQTFGPAPLAGIRLPRGEHRILVRFADGSVAQKTVYLDEQDLAVEFRFR